MCICVRVCTWVRVCREGGAHTQHPHCPGPPLHLQLRQTRAPGGRSGRRSRSRASGAQRPRWRWGRGRGREGWEGGRRRIREAPELFDRSRGRRRTRRTDGASWSSPAARSSGDEDPSSPSARSAAASECRPRAPLRARERRPAPGHHAAAAALLAAAACGAALAGARAEVLGANGEWARGAVARRLLPGAGRVPAGPSARRAPAPRAGDPPARAARAGGVWAVRGARAASGAPSTRVDRRGVLRGPLAAPLTRDRVARGRPGPGTRAPPGGLSEGGSAPASARYGPRGSCRAGEGRTRGPAPGPRRFGPTLPGDVSLEAVTNEDCFPLVQAGRHWKGQGTPHPALPGPGPPGQGAPSAGVTALTAAGFAFLAATSRRGPATGARCQARSAAQGPSQAAGRRPGPGVPAPGWGRPRGLAVFANP